jgi:plastocyanin domain-containing protein
MGEAFKTNFLKLAAVAVLYLGITSVNGSLIALESPLTLQSITSDISSLLTVNSPTVSQNNSIAINQNPEIDITSSGYSPTYLRVKKGEQVILTVKNIDSYTCASAFRIPSLHIVKNLQPNDTQLITFTPTKPGKISFTCSMGMYSGVIEVI